MSCQHDPISAPAIYPPEASRLVTLLINQHQTHVAVTALETAAGDEQASNRERLVAAAHLLTWSSTGRLPGTRASGPRKASRRRARSNDWDLREPELRLPSLSTSTTTRETGAAPHAASQAHTSIAEAVAHSGGATVECPPTSTRAPSHLNTSPGPQQEVPESDQIPASHAITDNLPLSSPPSPPLRGEVAEQREAGEGLPLATPAFRDGLPSPHASNPAVTSPQPARQNECRLTNHTHMSVANEPEPHLRADARLLTTQRAAQHVAQGVSLGYAHHGHMGAPAGRHMPAHDLSTSRPHLFRARDGPALAA